MIEDKIQYEIIKWANENRHEYPCLTYLHHSPNGGKRDRATGARLVSLGVRAGFPDLILPMPTGEYHGLYIELKTEAKSSRTSKDQDRWIAQLKEWGHCVRVCRSSDAAIEVILNYIKEKSVVGE